MVVLYPGLEVEILGAMRGFIVSVLIETGGVSYKVLWLNGQTSEEKWLPAFAVNPIGEGRLDIGFGAKRA